MEYYSIVGNSSDNSDSKNSGGASEPVFSKPQSPNQGLGGGSHHSTPQHTPQTPIAQEIEFATPLTGEWANSEGVPMRFRTVENLLDTTEEISNFEYSGVCFLAAEEARNVEESLY